MIEVPLGAVYAVFFFAGGLFAMAVIAWVTRSR